MSAALSFSASNDSIKGERESFRANAENNGCAIAVPTRRYAKSSCIYIRACARYLYRYLYVQALTDFCSDSNRFALFARITNQVNPNSRLPCSLTTNEKKRGTFDNSFFDVVSNISATELNVREIETATWRENC